MMIQRETNQGGKVFLRGRGRLKTAAVATMLVLLLARTVAAGYVVGIDFVNEPVHNCLINPVDVGADFFPFEFTDPSTPFAVDGALEGFSEDQVREAIVAAVQEAFRSAEIGVPGGMLDVNIVHGPVDPTVGTAHLVGDARRDFIPRLYGTSFLNGANLRPDLDHNPLCTNEYSLTFAHAVARIPELSPGLTFDTFDQVVNAIAGTTAHEIAHTLGVYQHVPGDPVGGVYPIMASGTSGLPREARLTDRRFFNIPETQPNPWPDGPLELSVTDVLLANAGTTAVSDFNFDGSTDISDFEVWAANRFTGGTGIKTGDASDDGATDVTDFNIWVNHRTTSPDEQGGGGDLAAEFIYNDVSGRMSMHTGRDDNVLSIIIPGPHVSESLLGRDTSTADDGCGCWERAYFAGKEQWYDPSLSGLTGELSIAAYPAGLTASDFGRVEYGTPGSGTGYADVAIVPEPGAIVLSLSGLLCLGLYAATSLKGPRRTVAALARALAPDTANRWRHRPAQQGSSRRARSRPPAGHCFPRPFALGQRDFSPKTCNFPCVCLYSISMGRVLVRPQRNPCALFFTRCFRVPVKATE